MKDRHKDCWSNLHEYPKRTAAVLWPDLTPNEILDRLISFIKTYDDTEGFGPLLESFVPELLSGSESAKVTFNRGLEFEMLGLAFETRGASYNWWHGHDGCDADEAFFIWMVFLCYCDYSELITDCLSFPAAFQGLREYCLRTVKYNVLSLLREVTCDIAIAYPWMHFPEVALTHILACVFSGKTHDLCDVIETKIQTKPPYEIQFDELYPSFETFCENEDWYRGAKYFEITKEQFAQIRKQYEEVEKILKDHYDTMC